MNILEFLKIPRKKQAGGLFITPYFAIKLLEGWQVAPAEFSEIPPKDPSAKYLYSFWRPKSGTGALQISAYDIGMKGHAKSILNNALRDDFKRTSIPLDLITKNGYELATAKFKSKKTLWKIRSICYKSKCAWLSYNCEGQDKNEKEWQEVDAIFDSFKFHDQS